MSSPTESSAAYDRLEGGDDVAGEFGRGRAPEGHEAVRAYHHDTDGRDTVKVSPLVARHRDDLQWHRGRAVVEVGARPSGRPEGR